MFLLKMGFSVVGGGAAFSNIAQGGRIPSAGPGHN